MSGIQRYEPWPQEWPMEDANGDLVTYEDHVKVVESLKADLAELVEAAHVCVAAFRSSEHSRLAAALAKIKEQQA